MSFSNLSFLFPPLFSFAFLFLFFASESEYIQRWFKLDKTTANGTTSSRVRRQKSFTDNQRIDRDCKAWNTVHAIRERSEDMEMRRKEMWRHVEMRGGDERAQLRFEHPPSHCSWQVRYLARRQVQKKERWEQRGKEEGKQRKEKKSQAQTRKHERQARAAHYILDFSESPPVNSLTRCSRNGVTSRPWIPFALNNPTIATHTTMTQNHKSNIHDGKWSTQTIRKNADDDAKKWCDRPSLHDCLVLCCLDGGCLSSLLGRDGNSDHLAATKAKRMTCSCQWSKRANNMDKKRTRKTKRNGIEWEGRNERCDIKENKRKRTTEADREKQNLEMKGEQRAKGVWMIAIQVHRKKDKEVSRRGNTRDQRAGRERVRVTRLTNERCTFFGWMHCERRRAAWLGREKSREFLRVEPNDSNTLGLLSVGVTQQIAGVKDEEQSQGSRHNFISPALLASSKYLQQ